MKIQTVIITAQILGKQKQMKWDQHCGITLSSGLQCQ